MTNLYQELGGDYYYCNLRVGLVIRNPDGREVYLQPGDTETKGRDAIAALDEVSPDRSNPKRAMVASIVFGELFEVSR